MHAKCKAPPALGNEHLGVRARIQSIGHGFIQSRTGRHSGMAIATAEEYEIEAAGGGTLDRRERNQGDVSRAGEV
jgi:hypothetical protein